MTLTRFFVRHRCPSCSCELVSSGYGALYLAPGWQEGKVFCPSCVEGQIVIRVPRNTEGLATFTAAEWDLFASRRQAEEWRAE